MKKELIGIIICILLVGTVLPVTGDVLVKNKTPIIDSKEDCGCNENKNQIDNDRICDWLYNFMSDIADFIGLTITRFLEEKDKGNDLKAFLIYLPAIPFVELYGFLQNIFYSLGCEAPYLS